jgi:hypothetical protein
MHPEQAPDGARRGDTAGADVEFLLCRAKVRDNGVEIQFGLRALVQRRLDKEVIQRAAAATLVRQQKPAAAQRSQHRLGHAGRAQAGHGGIEGIAAGLQRPCRGLRRGRMTGCHCALHLQGFTFTESVRGQNCIPSPPWRHTGL